MFIKNMFVSIVIPTKDINNYIKESISHILNLDYRNFEIIVLPDFEIKEIFEKTKIVPTGKIGPAEKRNMAIKFTSGEILAFLDDDAYPQRDWLSKAVAYFRYSNVAAVGGPAVTPETNSFGEKVSGAVFLSKLSGANPERYISIGKAKEVDDWPSVNLLVRKKDFLEIGGFDCAYWPGEDTKLCLDIKRKLGKKIIYDPAVSVWHHRRRGLSQHLGQIGNYGIHRGFFAKKFPENSFKLKYFVPSFFLIFVLLGWIMLFLSYPFRLAYLLIWTAYISSLATSALYIYIKTREVKVSLAAIPYIFLTHLYYGWRFIQGFVFTRELRSRLR